MDTERTKRRYNSPTRQAALAATHRRIIDAAGELFARDGYRLTTLAAIAEVAGVSVPRVNLSGSKPSLLVEAYEELATGSRTLRPVTDEAEPQRIMAMVTQDALPAYAAWLAGVHARSCSLWFALSDAAMSDEEAAEARAGVRARDREAAKAAVAWARSRDLLHGSAADERRAHVWDLLSNAETYRHLVLESGWSQEEYAAWVLHSLTVMVFTADAGPT